MNKKILKICSYISISILFISFISGCVQQKPQMSSLSFETVNDSLTLAETWITNNLNDEGYFNYRYDPLSEEYSSKNNMIRQLMASRLLAEMSQENTSLQSLHQKNLDYIFSNWYRENNGTGYIYFDEKSKLGAIAMAVRTLVYSPFFDDYEDEAYRLANCILSLLNDDGSFEPWYIEPSYSYDKDYLLTFYSGEAILSLVEFYQITNDTTFLKTAIISQNFYVDRYVNQMDDFYYPAYVPWHTQSLNKLYHITENQVYLEAIMTLNDKLLEIQDRDNTSAFLGRFYNDSTPQYGSPHSSSDAVYIEGLAYAYEIAELVGDEDHIRQYKQAITLGIQNLIGLQYNSSNWRINGAIRINADDMELRVDTTQHMADAFRKIIEVFFKV